MAKITEKKIKSSLIKQLKLQNKVTDFHMSLVEDYVRYWKLKEELATDIAENGIRIKAVNGNGILVEKTNDSIRNLQNTTATMLKILNDLNLKEPLSDDEEDGYL